MKKEDKFIITIIILIICLMCIYLGYGLEETNKRIDKLENSIINTNIKITQLKNDQQMYLESWMNTNNKLNHRVIHLEELLGVE